MSFISAKKTYGATLGALITVLSLILSLNLGSFAKADFHAPEPQRAVDVYILDSGLAGGSELRVDSKFVQYIDFTFDSSGEYAFRDCSTHGSKVSSIFRSEAGYAEYNLYILKVLGCRGDVVEDALSVAKALHWVEENMSQDSTTIINLSLSFGIPRTPGFNVIERLIDKGAVVVAAAGNNDGDACELAPGNIDGVINTGNLTVKSDGTPSLRGNSNSGDCVDFYSVGTYFCQVSERAIQTCGGTSFAAPVISAIIAKFASDSNARITAEDAFAKLNNRAIIVGEENLFYIAPSEAAYRTAHYAISD
jgi:subtilisin family serine protease